MIPLTHIIVILNNNFAKHDNIHTQSINTQRPSPESIGKAILGESLTLHFIAFRRSHLYTVIFLSTKVIIDKYFIQ